MKALNRQRAAQCNTKQYNTVYSRHVYICLSLWHNFLAMIFAIQSREAGFGVHISRKQLEESTFTVEVKTTLTPMHPLQYMVKREWRICLLWVHLSWVLSWVQTMRGIGLTIPHACPIWGLCWLHQSTLPAIWLCVSVQSLTGKVDKWIGCLYYKIEAMEKRSRECASQR